MRTRLGGCQLLSSRGQGAGLSQLRLSVFSNIFLRAASIALIPASLATTLSSTISIVPSEGRRKSYTSNFLINYHLSEEARLTNKAIIKMRFVHIVTMDVSF